MTIAKICEHRHEEAIARVKAFRELQDNWDSYGGEKTTFAAIETALGVMELLYFIRAISPDPVPINNGGIELQWTLPLSDKEADAIISISPTGVVRYHEIIA